MKLVLFKIIIIMKLLLINKNKSMKNVNDFNYIIQLLFFNNSNKS